MSTFNAATAQNLEDIEKQFAVKAVTHAQTYWSILELRRGSDLRLTKLDDEIYEEFKNAFPDYDAADVDEERMKNKEGKEKWRKFIQLWEKGDRKVDDYNFGTLLRRKAVDEYGESTTMFVPRMQFYAIEIARNKNGLNDWVKEQVDKEKEEAKAKEEAKEKEEAKAEAS